ncbi:MAG: hypothetical protein EOP04_15875 [Proteobacteria bacterium]|nr:MAG: hypothetical protein EOP04_15875 [Pseudomonadota bacterium]
MIILAVLHKYRPRAGLGTLISLMVPYTLVFFVVWTAFLLAWYYLGWPDAPIHYEPRSH